MASSWNNPLAYHTSKLLIIIAGLPDEEYKEVVSRLLEDLDPSSVLFHWGVFNTLVYNWAMFEEECRARRRCYDKRYLPEGVEPRGASAFFNEETRRVLAEACADMAPIWVIPSWIKWVANRLGIEIEGYREEDWGETLSKLVDYSVYIWGLRGLAHGYMEYFQIEGLEYATVVASHVRWELVETLAEPLESALEPLKRRFSLHLEKVRKVAFEAAIRFAETDGNANLGLREVAETALTRLREALVEALEEARMISRNA